MVTVRLAQIAIQMLKTDLKAAIVTDTGGVDDKSFNQSAWEGLQEWGKENGLSKDHGFTYFQSTNESEYANNLEQAASSGYKAIFWYWICSS